MRAMIARRKSTGRDPAPSKWRYRLQRWMLTPTFVTSLRVGVPVFLIAVIGTTFFSNPANREMVQATLAEAKSSIQHRPEFMLGSMTVEGATPLIEEQVRRVVQVPFPVSSFNLDLEDLKSSVTSLNTVSEAMVKVGDTGALVVVVTPREPVAIWRDGDVLNLLDRDGVFSGALDARADRLDLPLIAGEGAFASMDEALRLFEHAGPLGPRVRGLVRMGERRWDMVLDRGQRIQLPSDNPDAALDRIIVLNAAHDLLDRDVAVVDMRNAARPTVRLTTEAANALRRVKEIRVEE